MSNYKDPYNDKIYEQAFTCNCCKRELPVDENNPAYKNVYFHNVCEDCYIACDDGCVFLASQE